MDTESKAACSRGVNSCEAWCFMVVPVEVSKGFRRNPLRAARFLYLHSENATLRMQQMKKTHGRRGKTYSRAFTISGASKLFEKDRVTLHRWISSGVLKKCDRDGVYSPKSKFVWGCDVEDLLCDPKRKSGSRLVPAKVRARPLSKWQLAKQDPERSLGPRPDLVAVRECVIALRFVQDPRRALMLLKALQPALNDLRAVAAKTTRQR